MFEYKSEILVTTAKWFFNSANETDVSNLDRLINRRTAEGWEFVTYSYTLERIRCWSGVLFFRSILRG